MTSITSVDDWVPLSSVRGSEPRLVAVPLPFPVDDLFGNSVEQVQLLLSGASLGATVDSALAARYAFVLDDQTAITADIASIRPSHLQCLLAYLENRAVRGSLHLQPHVLDASAGLTLWSRTGADEASKVVAAWNRIVNAGVIDRLSGMTTPSLYGNKLRLTRFIAPIASIALPEGAPVLDLMAGTGIMTRALSERHPVFPNDPNPYAALLSGGQRLGQNGRDPEEVIAALRPAYLSNHATLYHLAQRAADTEAAFLHGETNADSLDRYIRFVAEEVLPVTDGQSKIPARLVTERYSNVYFGVAQSIEIDSLRHAIEVSLVSNSTERELCLIALLIACGTCASGPHFAQPIKAKSEGTLRTLIERRARSVAWEFDLALSRLTARSRPKNDISAATSLDWRDALSAFSAAHRGTPAGVYVDPPYSKLQYSRYYHVFNVLLAYDYPPVQGSGRYPPRSSRFSSRFEYQPRVAKRELEELIGRCAELGLTTMLSYSDSGFVGIEGLFATMANSFARVDRFSERVRHHSQGRVLAADKASVREKVLVGYPW